MNETGTITLRLLAQDLASGNIGKFIGNMDSMAKKGGLMGSVMQGVGQSFGQMLNPMMLATRAIGMVTDAVGDSIGAYQEDLRSQQQMKAALEANIPAWNGNTKAIEGLLSSRMRLGFSDDEQRQSLALLVAQVQDVNDALAIQRTAMDLARLKSISLESASTLLAKAYNGSATGLQKMGIRLKAGTDGMEAIAAVQQRTAGQAKAYSATMVGSAEAMKLSFGELQEQVGAALTDALTPFFNMIVAIADQAPDLDTGLGRLTQSYRDMIEVQKAANEEGQKQGDIFYDIYSLFAPQDRAIHDFTATLGRYSSILGVTRKDLALFTEAGLTLGKTLPEIQAALDGLVGTHVAERAKEVGYAWQTGMDTIVDSTPDAIRAIRRLQAVPFQILRSLTDVKGDWIAGWKNLASWAKDPFKPEDFQNWIKRRAKKAAANAAQAAADGKGEVRRNWTAIAKAARSPVTAALVAMGQDVDEAIAKVMAIQALAKRIDPLSIVVTGAGLGNNGNPVSRPDGSGGVEARASGGPVYAGRTYRVGENGEETLHMGRNGNGFVVPNGGGNSGGTTVHVHFHSVATPTEADGERIAASIGPALTRWQRRQGVVR
jgi:hypothetical protein